MKTKNGEQEKHATRKAIISDLFDVRKNGNKVIGSPFSGKDDPVRRKIREDLKPILDNFPEEFLQAHKGNIKNIILPSMQTGMKQIKPRDLESITSNINDLFQRSAQYQPAPPPIAEPVEAQTPPPPIAPRKLLAESNEVKEALDAILKNASELALEQEDLGNPIDPQASCKKSYKKLALAWHPDKNPQNTEAAVARFQSLNRANEIAQEFPDYINDRILYDVGILKQQRAKEANLKQSAQNISSGISDLVLFEPSAASAPSINSKAPAGKPRER